MVVSSQPVFHLFGLVDLYGIALCSRLGMLTALLALTPTNDSSRKIIGGVDGIDDSHI